MTLAATPDLISEGYSRCERIAERDKPHLFTASRSLAFAETRRAFASTYASMRLVDDFVDNIPHRRTLTPEARAAADHHIADWLRLVQAAHQGRAAGSPIWHALTDTFARFDLPLDPWRNLAAAMQSDLAVPFFRDWDHLRRYMEGASVAPAVVFMYLVLMRPDGPDGRFVAPWPYEEVHAATVDLAIFCYWVHILRDVAIDLSLGEDGLVYLPLADLEAFGLTPEDLRVMAEAGRASASYEAMAKSLAERARSHLEEGRKHLPRVLKIAPQGNAVALERLVDTYVAVLQELSDRRFDVFESRDRAVRGD